jgi:hypothetical protein
MAIVQLIYLSTGQLLPVSDFWYFDKSNPGLLQGRSSSVQALKDAMRTRELNTAPRWKNCIATLAWPSQETYQKQPFTPGLVINIAFALAWSEHGPAAYEEQPSSRYWVLHPDEGKILTVNEKLSDASKSLADCIADQTQF